MASSGGSCFLLIEPGGERLPSVCEGNDEIFVI
jgi:hypothetical protein